MDATTSWSFLTSISSIWLLPCAACAVFSKLAFSLQPIRSKRVCRVGFTQLLRRWWSARRPGQAVSFLLQTLFLLQRGLLFSLGSIPLSLQTLVSLFCFSFGQIGLGELLSQLLY